MKKISIGCCLLLVTALASGQKQVFDVTNYTQPKGWKKTTGKETVQFTKEDTATGAYCMITLYKSIESPQDAKANFDISWESLVKDNVTVNTAPEMQPASTEDGWEIQSGYAPFDKDDTKGIAILASATGSGKLVNLLILTNTDSYQENITNFIESISFRKSTGADTKPPKTPLSTGTVSTPSVKSKFAFSTTNFDDGWTATEQEDWVEVTKGNQKVLLHYPKEGTIIQADPEPFINNAWNILVAPRYSNLKNYLAAKPITEYSRGYLAEGIATDNKSGKEVYIALFRRGDSGFIEFILSNKNTFIELYGFDPASIRWDSDSKIWDGLQKMASYNKFAVAASDFTGTWSSDFTGLQQYYNIYTGQSAGMSMHQSNETFEFNGNSYSWKLLVVSGMVGTAKFDQAKSSGTFTIPNNWQVKFTKIESKAKTYNAYFSCIKGARLLWLEDAAHPTGYDSYGKK